MKDSELNEGIATARSGLVLLRADEPDAEQWWRAAGFRALADASTPEVERLRLLGAEEWLRFLDKLGDFERKLQKWKHLCKGLFATLECPHRRRTMCACPSLSAGRVSAMRLSCNVSLSMRRCRHSCRAGIFFKIQAQLPSES